MNDEGLPSSGCWRIEEPAHQLIGTTCSCLEWSAQCGNDVPRQWAEHLRATESA